MFSLTKPLLIKAITSRAFSLSILLCLASSSTIHLSAADDLEFFVYPGGNDANSGSKTEPFQTIQRGLEELRKAGAVSPGAKKYLTLAGGIYELDQAIILNEKDSGLTIRGFGKRNPPRLLGGKVAKGFVPVKDKRLMDILPPGVGAKVLVADLKKLGMTDYGRQKACGFGVAGTSPMELFIDGQRGTLARYPNAGWLSIAAIPKGKSGDAIKVGLDTDQLKRWKAESEAWLYGYWYHGWADRFLPVKAIDAMSKTITMHQMQHYGLRKGQRFFAQNLFCELDAPGEYYIDRNHGKIYLYPPKKGDFEAIVSLLETPVIQISKASDIRIERLNIEAGRSSGISVSESSDVVVKSCRISNVGETGVRVSGGKTCKIVDCEILATGSSGIVISGGNRKTLVPSGHLASGNHVHHVSRLRRTYTPAVAINGVGNRATQNHLHHAPHQAISFNGNDHLIDRNEIHHVVLETDDSGAIYTCPRDYTSRGTVIRHNYIHHSGPHHAPPIPAKLRTDKNVVYEPMHVHGTSLIYLDDLTGGMTVEGNVLVGSYRAMLIGGGRDNTISGNLILGGNIGIWIDGRGLGWAAKYVAKGGSHGFFKKYAAMKGDQPPYITRYPGLKDALTNNPAAPVNTVAHSNVILGAKFWKKTDGKSDPYIKFEKNHHGPAPQLAADASPEKTLKTCDPAMLKSIGFDPIPFHQIGPQSR